MTFIIFPTRHEQYAQIAQDDDTDRRYEVLIDPIKREFKPIDLSAYMEDDGRSSSLAMVNAPWQTRDELTARRVATLLAKRYPGVTFVIYQAQLEYIARAKEPSSAKYTEIGVLPE